MILLVNLEQTDVPTVNFTPQDGTIVIKLTAGTFTEGNFLGQVRINALGLSLCLNRVLDAGNGGRRGFLADPRLVKHAESGVSQAGGKIRTELGAERT